MKKFSSTIANKVFFLLSELAEIGFDQILPFMLGGDFNLSRFPSEKNKELEINRQNDVFNYVINLYELRELVMIGGTFMWWNNHKEPTLEKLDRVLVLKSWENFFPMAMVQKVVRDHSDHNPLILNLNNEHVKPSTIFRDELVWEKEEDFIDGV
jgi:endonuclease/exonuclease/phosphatase family metal-dependent hydrolase